MTYNELFQLHSGSLANAGQSLFSGAFSVKEQGAFFCCALEQKMFEQVAEVMQCALLSSAETAAGSLGARYFSAFMRIASRAKIPRSLITPLLYAAFYAKPYSPLDSWKEAVLTQLRRDAYADFDACAKNIVEFDPCLKTVSVLTKVDKHRALEFVLMQALQNNSASRLVLAEYKNETLALIKSRYLGESVADRKKLVKLLSISRHSAPTADYLKELLSVEKSKIIRRQIQDELDAPPPKKKPRKKITSKYRTVEFDKNGRAVVREGRSRFEFELTSDYKIAILPNQERTHALKCAYWRLKKQTAKRIYAYERKMAMGEPLSREQFFELFKTDSLFLLISKGLVFSAYNASALTFLFTVHEGRFLNIDGNEADFFGISEIRITHPLDIPQKYSFLFSQNERQPFLQLKRRFFSKDENDLTLGVVRRFEGAIVNAIPFKTGLGSDFRLLQSNTHNEGAAEFEGAYADFGGIVCLIRFSATSFKHNHFVKLGELRFYNSADLVRINGEPHFEKTPSVNPRRVDDVIFSECVYAVNRGRLNSRTIK